MSSIRLSHLQGDLNNRMKSLRNDYSAVTRSRKVVEEALLDGKAHYGINTGFGILANKRISADLLATLRATPGTSIAGAIAATAIGYAALVGYDWSALRSCVFFASTRAFFE